MYIGHQNFKHLIGIEQKQILIDPQQLNTYSYVRNNPVNGTDPSGKSTLEAWMASPLTTAMQVAVWTTGSSILSGSRPISAALMKHSLKLNSKDLEITENNQKNYGNVINAIKDSKEFNRVVQSSIESSTQEQLTSGIATSLSFETGDLLTSIGKADISFTAQKVQGGYNLNVQLDDTYNFEFKGAKEYKGSEGVISANNSAYLSQKAETISPYKVMAKFKTSYKNKKKK